MQSHWTRQDLAKELGNERILTACLEELCVRVTAKGVHFGDYTLKDHLRAAGAGSGVVKKEGE